MDSFLSCRFSLYVTPDSSRLLLGFHFPFKVLILVIINRTIKILACNDTGGCFPGTGADKMTVVVLACCEIRETRTKNAFFALYRQAEPKRNLQDKPSRPLPGTGHDHTHNHADKTHVSKTDIDMALCTW